MLLTLILSTFYFIPRSAPSGTGNQTPTPLESREPLTGQASTPDAAAAVKSYEYTQDYSDSTYRFSFKYPDDFTVSVVPPAENGNGETVLIESSDNKVGVQIIISPYGSDVDITAEMIARDIPELKISDAQPVEIGPSRKGLAFMSDNPAFCATPEPCAEVGGGKSREVWFVFNENLYQISTYAENDEFLKKMFSTWQFNI